MQRYQILSSFPRNAYFHSKLILLNVKRLGILLINRSIGSVRRFVGGVQGLD